MLTVLIERDVRVLGAIVVDGGLRSVVEDYRARLRPRAAYAKQRVTVLTATVGRVVGVGLLQALVAGQVGFVASDQAFPMLGVRYLAQETNIEALAVRGNELRKVGRDDWPIVTDPGLKKYYAVHVDAPFLFLW